MAATLGSVGRVAAAACLSVSLGRAGGNFSQPATLSGGGSDAAGWVCLFGDRL